MNPTPIVTVLSTIRRHQVRALLMGGQACVLYGGAEFSRDIDFLMSEEPEELARLRAALDELQAEPIAVPPFEAEHLHAGLAVHFRCRHPAAAGLRIDVMTRLRQREAFQTLWHRRTTLEVGEEAVELLDLADLVQAKKTQRDKDWPMIARLIESHHAGHRNEPTPGRRRFWLSEARTVGLLLELAQTFPTETVALIHSRPLLASAVERDEAALEQALGNEEAAEKAADRHYWQPLRETLERLRRDRPRGHT